MHSKPDWMSVKRKPRGPVRKRCRTPRIFITRSSWTPPGLVIHANQAMKESGSASQRLFDFIFDDGLDDLCHTKPQHRQISEECQGCHWLCTIFTVNRKTYEDGNQIEKQISRKEEDIGNNTIGLFVHWNMTNNPFYTQIILTPIEQYSMSTVTEPMICLHPLIEKGGFKI